MRIVGYGRGDYYFLTDKQFEGAMGVWSEGRSAYIEPLEALLPSPRYTAGVLPEHRDYKIFYTWNNTDTYISGLPGWVGVRKPHMDTEGKELSRGGIFTRAYNQSADRPNYFWREINVRDPRQLVCPSDLTSEEVKNFIMMIGVVGVDTMLDDKNLRASVIWEPLLPEHFLP